MGQVRLDTARAGRRGGEITLVKISDNHGAEILRRKLHRMDDPETLGDFAIDNVLGEPGLRYPNNAPNAPVEGTLKKLVLGHNEFIDRIAALEDAVARGPFG